MEAMYFLPYEMRKAEIPENLWTGSYDIGDGQFISFCQAFQYLGTFLTPTLDDNFDIDSRITAATKAFYSMCNVLLNKRIKLSFHVQFYLAIPINILLWGSDSWALSTDLCRKLKTCCNGENGLVINIMI
jgi:hypothetical protein